MQVSALSRRLPSSCSSPHSQAHAGRILRLVWPEITTTRPSCSHAQYYHSSQSSHASNREDHPLSLQNLQRLNPSVPHIFTSHSPSPTFNFAVEAHLLAHSHPASRILFTYTNKPCIVIGRNQNPWVECDLALLSRRTLEEDNKGNGRGIPDANPKRRHVQLVRRRSGGGAVFHDEGNLNYSIVVPGEGFERRTYVRMVVDALRSLQRKQGQGQGQGQEKGETDKGRRWDMVRANERNDIVALLKRDGNKENNTHSSEDKGGGAAAAEGEANWFKVSGTAFKLTRGRALHHGTLLHSSRHIGSIGALLRSPGKEYITAKGVESVRSAVANLYEVKEDAREQRDLARSLTEAIQRAWVTRYHITHGNTDEQASVVEVTSGHPEESVPELAAGIQELQTVAWRWDQTPGFSFDSQEVSAEGKTMRLGFEVKNGLIQSVETSDSLRTAYEERLLGRKVHELSAPGKWREAFMGVALPQEVSETLLERMVQRVEMCFPTVDQDDTSAENESGHEPCIEAGAWQIDRKTVRADPKDGRVEVEEQGSNTVVEEEPRQVLR